LGILNSMELSTLLKIKLDTTKEQEEYGRKMFEFETQHGLPPEMFREEVIKKIDLTQDDWIKITGYYLELLTDHKIKSGMDLMGESHLKLIERNKKIIINMLEGKELETI